MTDKERMVELGHHLFEQNFGKNYCRLVERPILPYDFGMTHWVWGIGENVVTVSDNRIVILNGIGLTLRQVMYVRIKLRETYIAILVPGQEAIHPIYLRPNVRLSVTPQSWHVLEHEDGFNFSLVGFVIEPVGVCINPFFGGGIMTVKIKNPEGFEYQCPSCKGCPQDMDLPPKDQLDTRVITNEHSKRKRIYLCPYFSQLV